MVGRQRASVLVFGSVFLLLADRGSRLAAFGSSLSIGLLSVSFDIHMVSVMLGWLVKGLRMCCDGCPGPKVAVFIEQSLCMRCSSCVEWSWLPCASFI